jgi:hypothetical protein
VDAVVINRDPMVGGLTIVQAKRLIEDHVEVRCLLVRFLFAEVRNPRVSVAADPIAFVESALAAINLWFGVALSLIGSVTVAPQAVPELWKVARGDAHKTQGFLAKFLPSLRRSTTVQAATVRVSATFLWHSLHTPREELLTCPRWRLSWLRYGRTLMQSGAMWETFASSVNERMASSAILGTSWLDRSKVTRSW